MNTITFLVIVGPSLGWCALRPISSGLGWRNMEAPAVIKPEVHPPCHADRRAQVVRGHDI